MLTFYRCYAEHLNYNEYQKIKQISKNYCWINFDKYSKAFYGTFYLFPKTEIPEDLLKKVKIPDRLEYGWHTKNGGYVSLETIADIYPEEIDKLFLRFKKEILKE